MHRLVNYMVSHTLSLHTRHKIRHKCAVEILLRRGSKSLAWALDFATPWQNPWLDIDFATQWQNIQGSTLDFATEWQNQGRLSRQVCCMCALNYIELL